MVSVILHHRANVVVLVIGVVGGDQVGFGAGEGAGQLGDRLGAGPAAGGNQHHGDGQHTTHGKTSRRGFTG